MPERNFLSPTHDSEDFDLALPASGELEPGRAVKLTSGAPEYCDAGDVPIGFTSIPVSATDRDVNPEKTTPVRLRSASSPVTIECPDAVTVGATIYTGASGQGDTTASNGRIGYALTAKAAGAGLIMVVLDVADLS
ncbi:MAG: DUF2190 family protein [Planctomycetota bacterium]